MQTHFHQTTLGRPNPQPCQCRHSWPSILEPIQSVDNLWNTFWCFQPEQRAAGRVNHFRITICRWILFHLAIFAQPRIQRLMLAASRTLAIPFSSRAPYLIAHKAYIWLHISDPEIHNTSISDPNRFLWPQEAKPQPDSPKGEEGCWPCCQTASSSASSSWCSRQDWRSLGKPWKGASQLLQFILQATNLQATQLPAQAAQLLTTASPAAWSEENTSPFTTSTTTTETFESTSSEFEPTEAFPRLNCGGRGFYQVG